MSREALKVGLRGCLTGSDKFGQVCTCGWVGGYVLYGTG